MPLPPDLYQRVTQMVAENRITEAMDLVEQQLPIMQEEMPDHFHAAVAFLREYDELQQKKIQGLLVAESAEREFSLRLLNYARELKEMRWGRYKKYTTPAPEPKPKPAAPQNPPPPEQRPAPAAYVPPASPKSGGVTLGKILLLVFLGLGAVIFLAVLVDAMAKSGWEEDGTDFSGLFNQQLPAAPAGSDPLGNPSTSGVQLEDPATLFGDAELEEANTTFGNQANSTVAARQAQLSNTTWWHGYLLTVQFGPGGNYGTYHNGVSGFYLTQVDDEGHFHGSFVAADGTTGTLYFQLPYDQDYLFVHFVNSYNGGQGSYQLQRQ